MKPLVYIIEDNLMMREFLMNYLREDYEIKPFEDAQEALKYITPYNQPELILLDYEMEKMDGIELLKILKSSGFYSKIPVIFLSGKTKSDYRIKSLEQGACDFITKPFNPLELKLKIDRVLNIHSYEVK